MLAASEMPSFSRVNLLCSQEFFKTLNVMALWKFITDHPVWAPAIHRPAHTLR